MKLILPILVSFLIGGIGSANAQEPALPPDTNPALLYWREFTVMPELDSEQFDRFSKSAAIDADYRNFIHQYDDLFRRLAKIRRFEGPCQWGDDLDEGPFLLLPYLAKARDVAKITSLRVRAHLEADRPDQAVDELLSAHTLAGHISESPILINILVKFAMNKIFAQVIAENLSRFSPDSLETLKEGIKAAPRGKEIADAIKTERRFMAGWLHQQLTKIKATAGDDPRIALEQAQDIVRLMFDTDTSDQVWTDFTRAGGESIEGLIEILENSNAEYQRLEDFCRLPAAQVLEQLEAFERETKATENPVRRWLFPSLSKSKARELGNDVLMAMVRTAVDIQTTGESAIRQSQDPIGGRPFQKSIFEYQGSPAGFILESEIASSRDKRTLFLTKPLLGLSLSGPDIGKIKESN